MLLFHYIPSDSVIHRLNPKTKILAIIIFSIFAVNLKNLYDNYVSFIYLYFLIFMVFLLAKIPFRLLLKDMKYFYVAIPLIVLLNSISLSPDKSRIFYIFSTEGLNYSLTFSLKLFLFSMISVVFIASTSVRQINFAVENLLRLIPGVPSVRIATMISLCIVQLPVIFDIYNSITLAQKSRCLDNVKNPFKKIKYTIVPLINKTIKNANNIFLNYQAKCYSENRSVFLYHFNRNDYLILFIFFVLCSLTLLM